MKALWVSVRFCGLWVFVGFLGLGWRREKGRRKWRRRERGGDGGGFFLVVDSVSKGGCFLDFLGLLGFTVGKSFGLVLP